MSIPANMNLLKSLCDEGSTQTTRLLHSGESMYRQMVSLQDDIPTQLHSNVFRYMHLFFSTYQLRQGFLPCVGCSLLIQIFEPLNCDYAQHIGFLTILHKNNAVLILPFTARHEPEMTNCRKARGNMCNSAFASRSFNSL